MSPQYLLGFDLGTTSSKGLIVDTAGRVVASHGVTHAIATPRPGWCELDGNTWWSDFCAVSRAMLASSGIDPRDIAGMCMSAMSPEMLPRPMMAAWPWRICPRRGRSPSRAARWQGRRCARNGSSRPLAGQWRAGCWSPGRRSR